MEIGKGKREIGKDGGGEETDRQKEWVRHTIRFI